MEPGLSSPLCLENICRINLLFRLEEYSVKQLLFLPTTVRRDLSLGLSLADILHFEAAGLFHDFDTTGVVKAGHQELLNVTFGTHSYLQNLFVPSILPALVPVSDENLPNNSDQVVLKHISESYASLPFSVRSQFMLGTVIRRDILPNRFFRFVSLVEGSYSNRLIKIYSPALLLEYCNVTPPKEVKVDLNDFSQSYSWLELKEVYFDKRKIIVHDPHVPLLQMFLSQVETIELGTNGFDVVGFDDSVETDYEQIMLEATSYFLLYNIIAGQQQPPYLKQIKIFGMPRFIKTILTTVKKFFSDSCLNDFPTSESWVPIQLATSPPAPYLLKSLSITHEPVSESYKSGKNCFGHSREYAANISASTQAILLFQLQSLEHVAINHGKGFCYEFETRVESIELGYYDIEYGDCYKETIHEYVAERNYSIPEHRQLLSTLTDLLKQPQLQSLSVGRAPLTEACQMVEAFLCIETTHCLSLTIEGVEEENKWRKHGWTDCDGGMFTCISDYSSSDQQSESDYQQSYYQENNVEPFSACPLPPPPAQPLPDSNGALKSLDISCSCDRLHAWLFSIPNLQLKELKTSRPDLVPSSGVSFLVIDTSVKA